MAYASPMKIANGLVLDFTVDNADTAADTFLGLNASGEVTKFASVPRARVSGGGNITEATSSVLSITGGTAAVLTSGLTIQVLQAGVAQSGYLSTTDWNTFNNKLGTSLTSAYIYVGNGSNVATGVAISGDITISNAGVVAIASGVIVNADINASAAIAVSKLAAVTASRVLGSDGSGFIQALDTATYPSLTELAYVKSVTSAIQTQLNNRLSVTLSSPTNGDVITYNGSAWVNSPSSTGVPTGGTTAQILRKIDNTNYNTEWHTLVAADITDVSSTAAELNKLSGVTTTATQFNFLNTLSGDVQAQLAAKLSTSLTQNYMIVGDASNIAVPLAPGTNGYVLTSVSGVPTWVSPGVGGTVTSVAASGGTTGMSFTGSPITTTGTLTLTGTLALANGGTGASLADPGADRIMFWDDSAGAVTWLTAGNGTTITTTTLSAGGTLSSDITFSADGLAHDFIYTSIGPGSSGQFKVYVDATSSILLSGATTIGGPLTTTASGTSASGMNIPHGTAPSVPVNGDFWSTSLGFYGRVNGVTVGPFGTGFTLANGNGTTANGSAVDLGGTLTGDVNIDGAHNVGFGQSTALTSFSVNADGGFMFTTGANSWGYSGGYLVMDSDFDNLISYDHAGAGKLNLHLGITDGISAEGFQIDDNGSVKFRIPLSGSNWQINLGSDAIGDLYQRNASNYFSRLASVSAGSFLRSGGVATVSAWSTVKLPDTMSALGLWVANSANTTVNLTATAGQSIRVNAGGTAWEAYTPGGGIGGSTGATDNSILRADGTGGTTLQNSSVFIDDSANITLGLASVTTGTDRYIYSEGSSANINIAISPKGAGVLYLGGASGIYVGGSVDFVDGDIALSTAMNTTLRAPSVSGNAFNVTVGAGSSSAANGNGGHYYIDYGRSHGTGLDGNIGLLTTSVANWQSMEGGVYLGNRVTAPTAGIANGVALFAEDSNSSSEFYVMPESGAKVNISGLFEPVTESGTTFTLNETHRNKIVLCTNSGAITVTVNTGKAAGWNCMLVATHATGTISLSASSTTINGVTATTAQFDTLSIVHYGSENYLSKLG